MQNRTRSLALYHANKNFCLQPFKVLKTCCKHLFKQSPLDGYKSHKFMIQKLIYLPVIILSWSAKCMSFIIASRQVYIKNVTHYCCSPGTSIVMGCRIVFVLCFFWIFFFAKILDMIVDIIFPWRPFQQSGLVHAVMVYCLYLDFVLSVLS